MPDNQIDRFKKFQRNSEQSLNKLLEVNGFSNREDFKDKVKVLNLYSKNFSIETVNDDLTPSNIEFISNLYDKYDAYINFIGEIDDILVDIVDMKEFTYGISLKYRKDKIASLILDINKSDSFQTLDLKKILSKIQFINSNMCIEFTLLDMNMSKISFSLKFIKDAPIKIKKTFVDYGWYMN